MTEEKEGALEELLRSSSEAFLGQQGSAALKAASQHRPNGSFLLMYESEEVLRATMTNPAGSGPGKFQFLPSEGIAFLYEQMGLPPPPGIAFNPASQCVVVAVVCLEGNDGGEGTIYQNMFVYSY